MSSKHCCVPQCVEIEGSNRVLHWFPNPAKDIARFRTWVHAIGGEILSLSNENIYKLRRVCHAHFEEKYCCRNNKISNIAVPTLLMPDFLSIKPLEQSIINRKVTVTGLPVNWLKMRWIKLERSKPYLVQFKCDYNEDTEFQTINIRKSLVGRPQSLKNIDQPLLYPKGRTVTREKWRDMMDLLKFIPPVKHDYYKNLSTNRNDESSHTADEDDIIYNIAE